MRVMMSPLHATFESWKVGRDRASIAGEEGLSSAGLTIEELINRVLSRFSGFVRLMETQFPTRVSPMQAKWPRFDGLASPEVLHQHHIAAGLINLRVENPAAIGRNGKCGGAPIDSGFFWELPEKCRPA
jgi:hypothetical protein